MVTARTPEKAGTKAGEAEEQSVSSRGCKCTVDCTASRGVRPDSEQNGLDSNQEIRENEQEKQEIEKVRLQRAGGVVQRADEACQQAEETGQQSGDAGK